MADILKIAEQLNSEVTRLNNERSKLEGMLESAKTNYEKAVKAYEVKYGVKLSEENIQSEYNDVFARTKGTVLDLQEKIESIKRGDYKTAETETYDLEPNVEPIREEKKAPAKRGRKPKEKAEEVKLAEPEVISEPVSEPNIEIPSGPLDLNLGFSGFGDVTEVSAPVSEVLPKTESPKVKGKPLSGADLSAALKASENVVQNPVSIPELSFGSSDEEDDEVPIDNLGIDMSFGANPNTTTNVSGDFGFGNLDNPSNPVSENAVVEDVPPIEDGGLGDFGNFGGFGGFGDSVETTPESTPEPTLSTENDTFGGFGDLGTIPETSTPNPEEATFGGLGNISETPTPTVTTESKEPVTPDGWGSEGSFDFSGFDDIFKSGDVKFGQ